MASDSFGGSSQTSGMSRASESGSASKTNTSRSLSSNKICTFWIGERCFGLDTALVGEVVSIDEHIPVPLAPPAIHGIFNLRGEPLPLVSLAEVLGIAPTVSQAKTKTAMVLRSGDLAAGLSIDRVEAILSTDRGTLTPPTNAAEDSIVLGFLEITTEKMSSVVSVLDPTNLLEKLSQLRYVQSENT